MSDLPSLIVTGLIGASSGGVLGVILTARNVARKTDAETDTIRAKTPAEIESIAVQTAEQALTMSQTTSAGLLAENVRLRAHVDRLEALLETYRKRMEAAEAAKRLLEAELQTARQGYDDLEREIASFRRQESTRG